MDALLDVEVGAGPAHPRMHIAWMDDRLVFFLFGGRVTDSEEATGVWRSHRQSDDGGGGG